MVVNQRVTFGKRTPDGLTFPLDAVIVLAVFVGGQRIRAGLRQQILRCARDPVLTGVLRAHAAGSRQTLDVTGERTLAGADPLTYGTARDHRILLGALGNRKDFVSHFMACISMLSFSQGS